MTEAADTRGVYFDVARLYLPIAVFVLVLVLALMALFVWRGRRRERAGQKDENNPLELAYAAVLAAVAAVLVGTTFSAQARIDRQAPAPPVDVRVVAAKWTWRFEYPRLGVAETGTPGRPAVLVVPVGAPIRFSATSLDVLHGFWLPELRFQRELVPGRTATFELTFTKPGFTSNGTCSFFCGLGHGDMRFAIQALPRTQFDAWVRGKR